jgi:hypothetical protein
MEGLGEAPLISDYHQSLPRRPSSVIPITSVHFIWISVNLYSRAYHDRCVNKFIRQTANQDAETSVSISDFFVNAVEFDQASVHLNGVLHELLIDVRTFRLELSLSMQDTTVKTFGGRDSRVRVLMIIRLEHFAEMSSLRLF